MKDAINVLGGNYFIVHHSQLRMNEKRLEDKIQGAIHHHPLGRRLHRWVGMGQSDDHPGDKNDPNYVCKLFFTYFRIDSVDYVSNSMIINGHNVSIRP